MRIEKEKKFFGLFDKTTVYFTIEDMARLRQFGYEGPYSFRVNLNTLAGLNGVALLQEVLYRSNLPVDKAGAESNSSDEA